MGKPSQMTYRNLGNSGLKVSLLSYGAGGSFGVQIKLPEIKEIMTKCRELGINFFDNSERYASGEAERLMGTAIKELQWVRSDIVLCTKLFHGTRMEHSVNDIGLSRKHVIEGTKASLERLQTDYVDIIYCHRSDPETPIEETVRAFNFVIDKGWALYWGTSNWNAQEFTEACEVAKRLNLIGPIVEQTEYNILHRQRFEVEYAPLYKKYGMGTTTYSPLAFGVLTGKYSGGAPEGSRLSLDIFSSFLNQKQEQIQKTELLKPVAEELDCSLAQLAIAWATKNPNVSTVITGATKLSQLEDNFKALEVVDKLTDEIMKKIDDAVQTKPKPDPVYRS